MVGLYYNDFLRRVELNFGRLSSDMYSNERVFRDSEYAWEGDWEGRALLSFVCLKRLTGKEIPTLAYEISHLKEKTNEYGYFGKATDGKTVSEQLLSGNGWYLRGLCEYYLDTKDEGIFALIESIVENLYLRCEELYDRYPTENRTEAGEVSGTLTKNEDGWILSTDVGCAYIALDGLTAAYGILKSEKLKRFLDKQIARFLSIDKLKCCMQTHATLTACRAIIRMYLITKDECYLKKAKNLFDFYTAHGMTLTYENFNWFGREDSWTEPCAVVDSLICSLYLYRELKDHHYLTLARRIYFNGINLGQRCNGGAGTNTCVTARNPVLKAEMFEAYFCCTMRLSEGLYQVSLFAEQLFAESDGEDKPVRDEYGRIFCGDRLMCSVNGGKLQFLPTMYRYSPEELKELRIKILFDERDKEECL